ncbi:Aste57867_12035 [Aphanomyces stellatus]|uniref:Aste57867_12035 protein n=1 Tax=Aphanomyces stellatus TaxID=120398 RepID=A0A485KVQ8_9STRA|nr:hypothetical protein As57867_011990 [Aphanomyces stellatus]VFT88890.1 Aste57867_12035 [Aphanomyces stellatus]
MAPTNELWDAVYAQDYPLTQKILESETGVDLVNCPHGVWHNTSLHVAVQHGNRKILNILVVYKGDVNAININGTTPLHVAVEALNKDLIQYLLQSGAKASKRNFTRKSPLELAKAMGASKEIVKMLEEQVNLDMGLKSTTKDAE